MLWTIAVVLMILWLLGFGFSLGGGLIHILLVITGQSKNSIAVKAHRGLEKLKALYKFA